MQFPTPIPEDFVGCRFDVAVAQLQGISRSKASALIASGVVFLANRKASKSAVLLTGDEIVCATETMESQEARESQETGVSQEAHDSRQTYDFNQTLQRLRDQYLRIEANMTIAYQDDDIVVVDKPVGMAAHQAQGWDGPTVGQALENRGISISATAGDENRRGIVSRLDVGTSGLMLVCRTDLAYEAMKQQFANHTVTKTYHALVQGDLTQNKATIEAPIGRAKVSDFRFTITPEGKPAVTHWDVLERFGRATLASVNLETGRTHQIRVHFTSIGHPLVGDSMYGANPVLAAQLGLERQWLHSTELTFTHPRTGKSVTVRSHYPSDLQHALEAMRALSK